MFNKPTKVKTHFPNYIFLFYLLTQIPNVSKEMKQSNILSPFLKWNRLEVEMGWDETSSLERKTDAQSAMQRRQFL